MDLTERLLRLLSLKIKKSLVVTCYEMDPYDIVIIQDPYGEIVSLQIIDLEF